MTEAQINQYKFRVNALEETLLEKQKKIEEYQTVEREADGKIKNMKKIHDDKVKNLLNSIQILKKQKASIQGLSKQHKRSKLIEQLNKQIGDQDLAIDVLRRWIYEKEGKEKGRMICDEVIIKALTKGPERIRPLTRQELKMEIDKLKTINLGLQSKLKNGEIRKKGFKNPEGSEDMSEISSISEESYVGQNEEILKKMKFIQFQNQNLKLDVSAKDKIIEGFKVDLHEKNTLKAEYLVLKNQIQIAERKADKYQQLNIQMKKQMNTKIVDILQREIKVEEMEIFSKQNSDKLNQAREQHNILFQELTAEKQQLEAEINSLKKQNEQLILENISLKKRYEEMTSKMVEIRQINTQQKSELGEKLSTLESQLSKLIDENSSLKDTCRTAETSLFKERADWVEQKTDLIQKLNKQQEGHANHEMVTTLMKEIDELREENKKYKDVLEQGGINTGGSDKSLLDRLLALQRHNKYLIDKYQNGKEGGDIFDEQYKQLNQLIHKYNNLLKEFEQYKLKYGPHLDAEDLQKHRIPVNRKQKHLYDEMSSGISKLNLQEIDTEILDRMNSNYEFSMEIVDGKQGYKISKADKQLLKLLNSDLWYFVEDKQVDQKIDEALSKSVEFDQKQVHLSQKTTEIKNLNHPKGFKVRMNQQDLNGLSDVSEGVSLTSARPAEINQYNSDVNVEIGQENQNRDIENLDVSSISSGKLLSETSSVGKKQKFKKAQAKASTLRLKDISSIEGSENMSKYLNSQVSLNSDVSSFGINESDLNDINSDLSADFRKNKKK